MLALHPRAVVLLIGTNDLEDQPDTDTVAGNAKTYSLQALEADNPKMPIILCEVFPSSANRETLEGERSQRVNQLYAGLVKKGDQQVTLLDTWTLFADANERRAGSGMSPTCSIRTQASYQKWAGCPAITGSGTTGGPLTITTH